MLYVPGKGRKQKIIEKRKKAGNYTTGDMVSRKYRQGNRDMKDDVLRYDSYKVKYEYTVHGKKYYKEMTFQSPGMAGTDYPISVTVYYNPGNPRKSICPEESEPNKGLGCLGTILLDVVICVLLLHFLR